MLTLEEQLELDGLQQELGTFTGRLTPDEQLELDGLQKELGTTPTDILIAPVEPAIEPDGNVLSPATSTGRVMLDQSLQGATFGFSDEARAFIGTAGAKAYGEIGSMLGLDVGDLADREFGDVLDEALSIERINLQAQQEAEPELALAANIGGALLTGGAGATTKGGKAVGRFIARGSGLGKVGRGALVGVPSGALAGAGTAVEGERLAGAVEGALFGAAGGGAGAGVVSAASTALRTTKDAVKSVAARIGILAEDGVLTSPKLTSEAVKKVANAAYKNAELKGGVLNVKTVDGFLDKIQKLKPQTEAGQLLTGDDAFTKVIDKAEKLRGSELTLQAAQEIDEFLGDTISGLTDLGKLTKQGKKVLDIQTIFRHTIETAPVGAVGDKAGFAALKEARKLWSASIKLSDIEKILTNAEFAARPDSAIKSGFAALAKNPKKMKGFSPSEQQLIKTAAKSGIVDDVLQLFGSRLNGIIGLSTHGVGTGALLQAGSAAGRGVRTASRKKSADKVIKEISRRIQGKQTPAQSGTARLLGTQGGAVGATGSLDDERAAQILERTRGLGGSTGNDGLRGGTGQDTLQADDQSTALTPEQKKLLSAYDDAENSINRFGKLSEARQEALVKISHHTPLSEIKKFRDAMNDESYALAARELVMSDWFKENQNSDNRIIIQQILRG